MKSKELHPLIPDMVSDYKKGKMNRREFLRFSALLGVSTYTAAQLGGFMLPRKALASAPKRGGVIKMSAKLVKITHPAQFSWIMPSNVVRQVCEYLTFYGADNVVKPYLAESWDVSEDLKTWTLNLRKGVTWNNGDAFTADDVVFTLNQWMDQDVKSSMLGLVGKYMDASGVEKVNDHQVKLHLNTPEIAVPEHLFHYPALILNAKTFEGDFLKAPVGTGPFTLESYEEGKAAVLKARKDYWQKGVDGKPLPYVDEVKILDVGASIEPHIGALKSGEVHLVDNSDLPGPQLPNAVKDDPNITILPVPTSTTRVLRMRVDAKPFDDNRVRMALKLCQNREKILALAYQNEGLQGQDIHVYPNHPDYCEVPTPAYDPAKAKALLAEAGYPDGIEMDLAVGSDWPEVVRYAEVLKQDAKAAGITINIKTMPNPQYWEKWTEVPLGITPWTHRPLGAMLANLAYINDSEGNPVPWNETRWVDKEYSELVTQVNGTVNMEERRKLFCKIEKIQQERGSIGVAFWMNTWSCPRKELKGIEAHPNLYYMFAAAWLES
jgi:peptide/nickel transport system substrate-binding protein